MRAWRKYWFTAVSSFVRTSFSRSRIAGSPFIGTSEPGWLSSVSRGARRAQPARAPRPARGRAYAAWARGHPGQGGLAQGVRSRTSASTASTQQPHAVPAPVACAISSRLRAPESTAPATAPSDTLWQIHTIIGRSPSGVGASLAPARAAVGEGLPGASLDGLHVDLARDLGIEGDRGLAHLDDVRRRALVEAERAARDHPERGEPVHAVVELRGDEDDPSRRADVEGAQPGDERPDRPLECAAALAGRDRLSVRAGRRMAEQRAHRVRRLAGEDVLELARLGLHRALPEIEADEPARRELREVDGARVRGVIGRGRGEDALRGVPALLALREDMLEDLLQPPGIGSVQGVLPFPSFFRSE